MKSSIMEAAGVLWEVPSLGLRKFAAAVFSIYGVLTVNTIFAVACTAVAMATVHLRGRVMEISR